MPRTADLVRQAARVAEAVQDTVETEQDLDSVVGTAVRNSSRDLLVATDHLRQTNHMVANLVASQIEHDFMNSLSFPVGN